MSFEKIGFLGIFVIGLFILVGIWFGIVTATTIATFLGCTGLKWWIVSITIFGALGGCGGSIINISKD